MPEIWIYLMKANIALVLFYLGYHYGLRRLTFYTLNRCYLMAGIVLSACLPLVSAGDIARGSQAVGGAVVRYAPDWRLIAEQGAAPAPVSAWAVVTWLFWAGVAVMALRFVMQLISIFSIHLATRESVVCREKVRLMTDKLNPFSFFGAIYVNPSLHPAGQLENVIAHERIHARGLHSLDILAAELQKIFYWFNPGAWLMKRAVAQNLEFIADRRILALGIDRRRYQYSLLKAGCTEPGTAMVNHFNLSHLKKRILMMNRARSGRAHLLKYLVLVPLVAVCALVISAGRPEGGAHSPQAAAAEGLRGVVFPDRATRDTDAKPAGQVNQASAPSPDTTGTPRYPDVLYIVDGTKRDSVYMTRNIAPKDVYSISVYKGKSAVKTYGPKGARGVIVIQTREAAKAAGMPGAGDTVQPRRAQAPSGEAFSGTPAKVMIRGEKDSVPGNGGEVSLSRALVVVDGTIEDTGYLSRMAPHQIRSITVLKDQEAVSLFGDRGKNGAILIKTRKQTDSTRR